VPPDSNPEPIVRLKQRASGPDADARGMAITLHPRSRQGSGTIEACHSGGFMREGEKVADFSAADQDGESVSLSGLLRQGPVALFFYPKAMTPG
jgi:hypothetical protein